MPDAGQSAAENTTPTRRSSAWAAVAPLILFLVASLIAFNQAPNPRIEGRGWVDSFLYPLERNPADRLMRVEGTLTAVAMSADGQRAVAVGDNGMILTSRDGGLNWKAQASRTANRLLGVAMSANGKLAVAVGEGGVILTRRDDEADWALQTRDSSRALWGVALSEDGQRAVAVGKGGVILTSSDGGVSWNMQTNGRGYWLNGVSLTKDGQRAVAVGQGGMILTSSDGGENWEERTSRIRNSLKDVWLSGDGQRAVAVGIYGTILTSGNGGSSWEQSASGTNRYIDGVWLSGDAKRAVIVGDRVVRTSQDGGATWAERTSGTTNELIDVSVASDGQHAIAVGKGGTILISRDAGASWTTQAGGMPVELWGVWIAADGQRGVAAGRTDDIFTSRDSGQNWTPVASSFNRDWLEKLVVRRRVFSIVGQRGIYQPNRNIQANNAIDALNDFAMHGEGQSAVAVGADGLILTSRDGGTSWAAQASGTTETLFGVSFSGDGRRVVAVGQRGVILTSLDGGTSWATQSSGTTERLWGVSLSRDGTQAVVVGEDGVILTSRDGGISWSVRTSGTTEWLDGVSLSDDGQRAVAVGEDGVILTSRDGGTSWAAQASGTTEWLVSVWLSGDGQRAVAVGDGGVILNSGDGGTSWARQTSGTTSQLTDVSLSDDGLRAAVVGEYGTILTSSDGGTSWVRRSISPTPDYSRYPAPWYVIILLLCAALLYRAFSGRAQPTETGAAAMAATDSPTISLDQDRLDFAPLARGISRFLRNRKTEPPLTLAITGEWGTGKSSLMGLVCADLRANRWRPVWFNAWHHQNEEQLLAALLVEVRESGVPPILLPKTLIPSLDGIVFRVRLFGIRISTRPLVATIFVALAALFFAMAVKNPEPAQWQWAMKIVDILGGKQSGLDLAVLASIPKIPKIVGIITAVFLIIRTVKAFGVNPAVLLSSTMAKFRLKDASAQTSFRMRFAEQFREVTDALAYPMVIVIDDLDRCKPETVLEVMEAVNFLTSSGKCFVIFGMATQRVQAALALSFKEIAVELVDLDPSVTGTGDTNPQPARERKQRREYARQYLEKLINIEILVPDCSDLPPSQLLESRAPAPRDGLARIIAKAQRWLWLLPVSLAVALSFWLAPTMPVPVESKAASTPPTEKTKAADAAKSPKVEQPKTATVSQATRATTPQPVTTTPPAEQPPVITPGGDRDISRLWFVAALASLLGAGFFFWRRWYRQSVIVEDTKAFNEAMRIWAPIATFANPSPRSIKRFGNRIRYLAMLQQGEQLDEPPVTERLLDMLANNYVALRDRLLASAATGQSAAAPSASETGKATAKAEARALALSEHRVVALGAMHAHFGPEWRSNVENSVKINWLTWLKSNEPQIYEKFKPATEAYSALTKSIWPPPPEELDAFERSLKGVRLPGDGLTFDQVAAASAAQSEAVFKDLLATEEVAKYFDELDTNSDHPESPAYRQKALRAKVAERLKENDAKRGIEPAPPPPPASPTPQPRKRRTPPKK